MAETRLDQRFFESTRGRIVRLLQNSPRTVNEIAAELGLTDNAIRAHLLSLERDRLVAQSGTVKGFRRPHYSYALTDEARNLFPKPYDSLLNKLLTVLKNTLSPAAIISTLKEVGRSIGVENATAVTADAGTKLDAALRTLEELGGSPQAVRENGRLLIKSESCPFAEAVTEHPEVCRIAESMVGEIVGESVKETCDRKGSPKCRFEISSSGGSDPSSSPSSSSSPV